MPARSKRKNLIYLLVFTCLFVLCLPFVLLYSLGYDLGKNFSIFKTGGIYVYTSESGAQIFVDDELSETTSLFQRGILLKQLSPEEYHVRVSKEGYLDWKKNISVEGEKVAEAYPFLIPSKPLLTDIPKQIKATSATTSPLVFNPVYKKLLSLFDSKANQIPDVATSTSIENAKVAIEKEGNLLRAYWKGTADRTPFYFCLVDAPICKNDFVVYISKSIEHFDFYPGRNDVILIALGDKLVVTELDKRSPQNTETLYVSKKNVAIDFRIVDNETLVIKEGEALTELKLVYEK